MIRTKNNLHEEQCKAWATLPKRDRIYAVVPKAKQVFAFNTGVAEFVEDFMIDVGHHDYYLCAPKHDNTYDGLLLPKGAKLAENLKMGKRWSWEKLNQAWSVTEVNVEIQACSRMGKQGSEWRACGYKFNFQPRKWTVK